MTQDSLFQYRAYSDHPSIKLQGERLFQEFQASRRRRVADKNDIASYRRAFITALAGLYYGGAFKPDRFVRVPFGNDHYNGHSRLSPVFRSKLLKVFNWLHDNGYLERVAPPKMDEGGKWVPAGYRLTTKWLRLAQEIGPDQHHQEVAQTIKTNPRHHQYVVLKDEKKQEIRAKPSPQRDFTIKLLTAYDNALQRHQITLGEAVLPPLMLTLSRKYNNGSYTQGGRFYGDYQNKRSQVRLHFQIDGENVCEVDYKYLHPTLLYMQEGLDLQHDVYELEGFPRSVAKQAFQIMVNSGKPFPQVKSLIFYLNKEKRSEKRRGDEAWQGIKIDKVYCTDLANAIAARCPEIKHHFGTGIGLRLQHTDSIMVSAVLEYLQRAHPDVLALPIHDSFLLKQRDLPALMEALGYAEHILRQLKQFPDRQPLIEISVLKTKMVDGYDELLKKLGVDVEKASYAEEDILKEVDCFFDTDDADKP